MGEVFCLFLQIETGALFQYYLYSQVIFIYLKDNSKNSHTYPKLIFKLNLIHLILLVQWKMLNLINQAGFLQHREINIYGLLLEGQRSDTSSY